MILPETFQVATIVEKLPLAWRDFKNYLKHKRKQLKLKISLWDFKLRRTTESPRKKQQEILWSQGQCNQRLKGKTFTFKGLKQKKIALGYKGKDQEGKNKRFKGTCFIGNKEGHKANEYRSRPKKKKKDHSQINLTNHASPSLSAVVSEVNLTTNNKRREKVFYYFY